MRLAIVADVYPPLRSSGAVQLRDLSQELVRQGHDVTMIVASPELDVAWKIESSCGVRVVRLKTPRTKDTGYVRRALGELLMPFAMLKGLKKAGLAQTAWEGIVWYSPTIFLGPVVQSLKRVSQCRSYLVIRDIFPDWAVDMGMIGRGLPYWFFRAVANYQYSLADVIGVQTPGNQAYFAEWLQRGAHRRVEVLHNWLDDAERTGCSISINDGPLAGRKIFVYAGNMGIAQGMGILLDLAESMKDRPEVGFLFVGRGSDAGRLRAEAAARKLANVVFHDEIDPDEIPGLYSQCHAGLVALDPRHKTHNIPGKFLSYMNCGLPVLAAVNPGNDLVRLIEEERVGHVCAGTDVVELKAAAQRLLDELQTAADYFARCRALSARLFSPARAAAQITRALHVVNSRPNVTAAASPVNQPSLSAQGRERTGMQASSESGYLKTLREPLDNG